MKEKKCMLGICLRGVGYPVTLYKKVLREGVGTALIFRHFFCRIRPPQADRVTTGWYCIPWSQHSETGKKCVSQIFGSTVGSLNGPELCRFCRSFLPSIRVTYVCMSLVFVHLEIGWRSWVNTGSFTGRFWCIETKPFSQSGLTAHVMSGRAHVLMRHFPGMFVCDLWSDRVPSVSKALLCKGFPRK